MFCAILAADTAVQNSALVELNAVCVWFLDLQTAAPLARNVAQPVVDLRLGFTPARAASTKQTMAGSFGSFWEVWQFVQQRHRRVTEVTFGEIDCRGSCRVVHLVSHSPFLCLTQMGHNVFRAFAVNFCGLCQEFCHCSDGKANMWATCHGGTECFAKQCAMGESHLFLWLFVFC